MASHQQSSNKIAFDKEILSADHSNLTQGDIALAMPHADPAKIVADTTSHHIEGTLNEQISTTLKRDLVNIWMKLRMVLNPKMDKENILREWDLWGPLLLCLLLAM